MDLKGSIVADTPMDEIEPFRSMRFSIVVGWPLLVTSRPPSFRHGCFVPMGCVLDDASRFYFLSMYWFLRIFTYSYVEATGGIGRHSCTTNGITVFFQQAIFGQNFLGNKAILPKLLAGTFYLMRHVEHFQLILRRLHISNVLGLHQKRSSLDNYLVPNCQLSQLNTAQRSTAQLGWHWWQRCLSHWISHTSIFVWIYSNSLEVHLKKKKYTLYLVTQWGYG